MKDMISPIYKILLLYEDVIDKDSLVSENDYIRYLDRMYVRYLGAGKEFREVYETINGLKSLGSSASHSTVKANVFHMIDIIEKGGFNNGV